MKRQPVALLALAAALALGGLWGCGADAPARTTPSIVFIIGDDHGYLDFGFMGSEWVQTPNLDQLAGQGTVFPNAYVTASICGPSLRSLVTGLHPYQWTLRKLHLQSGGVSRSGESEIQDFVTLPRLLSEVGYASYQAGKFFGGSYDLAGFSEGMNGPGDELGFGGAGKQLGRAIPLAPVHDFLDRHGDAPFFLWFAPMLPHHPFDAGPEYSAPYQGRGLSGPALKYYANITRFDALVGELVAALEERGLREQTLIVYLADNGWDQGPGDSPPGAVTGGWERDGEKGKYSMHELGFRTPIVLNWPGQVPAGVVNEGLVSAVDLFPTVLDYAGAPPRPERPGSSLRAAVEGRAPWQREALVGGMIHVRGSELRSLPPEGRKFLEPEPAYFVRDRDWHYIHYEAWGAEQLFDLRKDPDENHDLAPHRPELTARYRARIEQWKQEMQRSYMSALTAPPAFTAPAAQSPPSQ
ncbi:MAG: sulfatase-like hydrolase/transferase [Deltaproteobacteria bacterium]|nr:sulfatase-like hydrolase/transferase [Deltaproteobacteria bacterium]MBW2419414.1 sulfatase-like hydrolase/transferase [Deltaproteobacteria bacterium]